MGLNKFPQIVLGFIWIISSIMLIIYGWSMIVDIADLVSGDTVFTVMYWIGIFIMFMLCGILPPYWLVISAYNNEE